MVRDGELGRIRFVAAEHASGWASAQVDQWRMDPERGGVATAVADVGTHAFHLLRYITGLEATRVSAELSTLVPGRPVFDNATMRLTLSNGAPATVWATMAATGHEHGLRIRVFGDDASLEWRHEDPQHLIVRDPDGGTTILAQGMSALSDDAARITRVGLGHPEGFLEAFANFYLDLAEMLRRTDGPRTVHPHRRRRPHRRPIRRGDGRLARQRRRLGQFSGKSVSTHANSTTDRVRRRTLIVGGRGGARKGAPMSRFTEKMYRNARTSTHGHGHRRTARARPPHLG